MVLPVSRLLSTVLFFLSLWNIARTCDREALSCHRLGSQAETLIHGEIHGARSARLPGHAHWDDYNRKGYCKLHQFCCSLPVELEIHNET